MSDKIFAEGIYYNAKHEKAPEWVLGSLSIKPKEFAEFINKQEINGAGYVKLSILMSQKGKPYMAVDTWKPQAQGGNAPVNKQESVPQISLDNEVNVDDVPFN